jgi:hypothetical protein
MQLRGNAAKGYAFDRRYPQDTTSDTIYEDCVSSLVESCFKVWVVVERTVIGKPTCMLEVQCTCSASTCLLTCC